MRSVRTIKSRGEGWFKPTRDRDTLTLAIGGDWQLAAAVEFDRELARLDTSGIRQMRIDASEVGKMDSAGAWLIIRTKREAEAKGITVASLLVPSAFNTLFDMLDKTHTSPPAQLPSHPTFNQWLERIGRTTVHLGETALGMLSYLGQVFIETFEAITNPKQELRITALVKQIELTGLNAMPIVGLLSFLIGVVLAYQGLDQLERFGAQIFAINLVGVAILRELGGLITAIIVAGRSGSAFTAQIGTMQVNEELSAMETIGLNVVEVLVLPRMIGLIITLPILTLWADLCGIFGGFIMVWAELGVPFTAFLRELHGAVTTTTFMLGMIKAPVFAMIIALVGCYEGLRVERNAASVGSQTTRSVVEAIFLVIVFDAGFSILFSILDL
jgi:phospholipid/cholesterol/gamma-HCH transport system permease protein